MYKELRPHVNSQPGSAPPLAPHLKMTRAGFGPGTFTLRAEHCANSPNRNLLKISYNMPYNPPSKLIVLTYLYNVRTERGTPY